MNKIEALLLDLDGTLLDIEVSFFLRTMTDSMVSYFEDLVPGDLFKAGLSGSIRELTVAPRKDGQNNEYIFYSYFSSTTGVPESTAKDRFSSFYRDIFPGFSRHGTPVAGAARLVEAASAEGIALVLATSPIFPREAILERMKWCRIPPVHFEIIADMESTRFCKPQARYFTDLAGALHIPPERCLMAGNDLSHDMAAGRTGMKTFLATTHMIDRQEPAADPDFSGDLDALGRLLDLW